MDPKTHCKLLSNEVCELRAEVTKMQTEVTSLQQEIVVLRQQLSAHTSFNALMIELQTTCTNFAQSSLNNYVMLTSAVQQLTKHVQELTCQKEENLEKI